MSRTTLPKLQTIFSDILSDMAFIFVADPDDGVSLGEYTLQVRVSYKGPQNGILQLRCDGRFAAVVAANLLGVDEEDSAAEQGRLDALKELMNVVCGNLVTELYGTEGLFELTIPEVTAILPGEEQERAEGAEAHVFVAEGGLPVELTHIPA